MALLRLHMKAASAGAGLASLILLLCNPSPVLGDVIGDKSQGGTRITTTLTQAQLANLSMGYTLDGKPDPIRYEYISVVACPGVGPESSERDRYCMTAWVACQG